MSDKREPRLSRGVFGEGESVMDSHLLDAPDGIEVRVGDQRFVCDRGVWHIISNVPEPPRLAALLDRIVELEDQVKP